MRWVVLLARVAAEPSRHRVAVWRELRRLGAVAIGRLVIRRAVIRELRVGELDIGRLRVGRIEVTEPEH